MRAVLPDHAALFVTTVLMEPYGWWCPLTPGEVAERLGAFNGPWWIAGGWAIDLFLGRQTRPHGDTDVLVLRCDQLALQQVLEGWICKRPTL